MAQYRLTNRAVDDLSQIWYYTVEVWSEKQADKYYKELIATCEKIANSPEIGKPYNEIAEQLLGIRTNKHIIFYRKVDGDFVEIIRVLHSSMDLDKRISE